MGRRRGANQILGSNDIGWENPTIKFTSLLTNYLHEEEDGSFRLCLDYPAINAITEHDRYPLPLIAELHERIQHAKYFTKLDLNNGYNLIRIPPGEEWKTAFKTKYGLYKYRVMPFGLSNSPVTFQRIMDSVLAPITGSNKPGYRVVCYIDYVLIYTNGTEEEYIALVNKVLEELERANLAVNGDKSEIMQ